MAADFFPAICGCRDCRDRPRRAWAAQAGLRERSARIGRAERRAVFVQRWMDYWNRPVYFPALSRFLSTGTEGRYGE